MLAYYPHIPVSQSETFQTYVSQFSTSVEITVVTGSNPTFSKAHFAISFSWSHNFHFVSQEYDQRSLPFERVTF